MNITFCITEKSGKISPTHADGLWDTPKERFGECGFFRLCWILLKWYLRVKKQAWHSHKMREADRLNYVFRTRQVLTIESEN